MNEHFWYISAAKIQNSQLGDATCEGMSELEAMCQMTKAKSDSEIGIRIGMALTIFDL